MPITAQSLLPIDSPNSMILLSFGALVITKSKTEDA